MAVQVGRPVQGLTEGEARDRHRSGQGNNTSIRSGRSYWDIARANLFTLFNNILFTIGVALIAVGRVNDAITSVGLGLVNALISTVQEIRAKRQLDGIALVTRPTVTVVRDGRAQVVAPSDVVKGDSIQLLRPQARETIDAFRTLGLELKIISGDDPHTVAALAKQAGLGDGMRLVSGPQLAGMTSGEFDQAAAEASIFGRITPEQKERLVDALLRQGKRVAMMGDGVNDVLALKKASLGIAMQSGSSAARNVADMILLDDSFAALRPAFHEGQRIIGGMTNALFLFLTRVATTTLIIIAVTMVGLDFPFDPAQVALTTFTVGVPAFFLTLWARPQRLHRQLLWSLARFVFPVAIVTMLLAVGIYVIDYRFLLNSPLTQSDALFASELFESYTGVSFGSASYSNAVATVLAQGSVSVFISWTACLLILFLEPPNRFFLGWRTEVSPDKRPAWLALGLFLLFWLIWSFRPLGYYFGILEKPLPIQLLIFLVVVVWFFVVRAVWRARLFERFLGLDAGEVHE